MTVAAKTAPYGEASLTLKRVFDAPRSLVWKAWTDPKMMAQWFGPRGFTIPVCELDVCRGGSLRIVMRGPDGNDYPMKGVFLAVVEPERLVFTSIAVDNDGKHLLEGETTVTFSEEGGKTTLTLQTHAVGLVPFAPSMLGGMEGPSCNRSQTSIHVIQASSIAMTHSAPAVHRLRRASAAPIAATVSGDSTSPSRVISST
jgi:uncharacterized protein YndB with AHSA1/START domain